MDLELNPPMSASVPGKKTRSLHLGTKIGSDICAMPEIFQQNLEHRVCWGLLSGNLNISTMATRVIRKQIGHLNGHAYLEHLVAKDAIWKVTEDPPPQYANDMDEGPSAEADPEEVTVAEAKD